MYTEDVDDFEHLDDFADFSANDWDLVDAIQAQASTSIVPQELGEVSSPSKRVESPSNSSSPGASSSSYHSTPRSERDYPSREMNRLFRSSIYPTLIKHPRPLRSRGRTSGSPHAFAPPAARRYRGTNLHARFRKSGALSVTDLVGPLWCEVKFDYGLRWAPKGLRVAAKPDTVITAKGNEIAVRKDEAEKGEAIMDAGTVSRQ